MTWGDWLYLKAYCTASRPGLYRNRQLRRKWPSRRGKNKCSHRRGGSSARGRRPTHRQRPPRRQWRYRPFLRGGRLCMSIAPTSCKGRRSTTRNNANSGYSRKGRIRSTGPSGERTGLFLQLRVQEDLARV